ncbi:MAG TPA: fused MFS/spermidine synthase [Roseiflexaceae bacterium]|nr:fused MFS/spermidine synthase [Roseiflexaceae bacterium]
MTWQDEHLASLAQRLVALDSLADGIIHDEQSPLHHIQLIKAAGQIQFYFVDRASGALEGPMSRMEIARPLRLLAGYTQAAMLTLLWAAEPARVCLLGMAGGRLSLLFYHYFTATTIDNVDIDPAVAAIASRYFGITFDQRQRIAIQDARAFLEAGLPTEAAPAGKGAYDIIVMDAFRDASDDLEHLATSQFYQVCTRRLRPSGVVCVNLLKSDTRFFAKGKTVLSCFPHVLASQHKHSLVLLASHQRRLTPDQIAGRAASLQRRHGFEFPFEERAAALQSTRAIAEYRAQALRDVTALEDERRRTKAEGG